MLTESLLPLIIVGEALLVALGVCGWLVWLLRRARRRISQQRTQMSLLMKRQTEVFLNREIAHTRELSGQWRALGDRKASLADLRLRWLEIERKALVKNGAAGSDPYILERAAQPLVAMLNDNAGASAATPGGIEQARAVVALQKDVITELKQQLAAAADDGRDRARDSTALAAALDELARLRDEAAAYSPGDGAAGQGSADGGVSRIDSASNLLDEMAGFHRDSIDELKRIRDTNARQRNIILELEKQISVMREGSMEQAATQVFLDHLKSQLREYENCTATLEMETENLRQRIRALNQIISTARQDGNHELAETLQRQLPADPDTQQTYRAQSIGARKLAKLASADSVDRASAPLLEWFDGMDLATVIYVKGTVNQYWLASGSSPIDSRARQILQSVVPDAGSAWLDVRGAAVYAGATVRLLVEAQGAGPEAFEALKEALTPMFRILDALLGHIDSGAEGNASVKRLRGTLEQTRQMIVRIDAQHQYLLEENLRIGEKLHSELQQYFGSLTLTELQQDCVDGMLEDFKSEVALLSRAAKAIHKNLQQASHAIAESE